MESFLRTLMERHPNRAADIIRLAGEDANFVSVCEDIVSAENALVHWTHLPARAREYREILEGLYREFWLLLSRSTK